MIAGEFSLEELSNYKGISIKPSDFGEYWKRSLQELPPTPTVLEESLANFSSDYAVCKELFFLSLDNERIHVRYLYPKSKTAKKCPALIKFHGYTKHSDDWYLLLPYVAAGFHVFAMDCRGQGGLSTDMHGGDTLSGHIIRGLGYSRSEMQYRNIFLDAVALVRIIQSNDTIDGGRICLIGDSQGGAIALATAALVPTIRKISVRYPFLCDIQRTYEMGLGNIAYQELRDYIRQKDPRHEKFESIFTQLGYIDMINFAEYIRSDVLLTTGLEDDFCPPSTQYAMYNRLKSKKNVVLYPDYGHEPIYPDFFDIQYNFITNM